MRSLIMTSEGTIPRALPLLFITMAAVLGGEKAAYAACTINGGGPGPSGTQYDGYSPMASQFPITPAQAVIPVPNNPASGEVLMRMTRPLPSFSGAAQGRATAYYGCVRNTVEQFSGIGALAGGFSNVYSTGVQGIGYRIAYYMQAGDPSSAIFAPTSYSNPYNNGVLFFPFSGSSAGSNVETMIELVATGGPIGTGTINASQVAAQVSVLGAPATQLYRVSLASSITVANPTCDTTSSALLLTLPDVSTTTLLQEGEGPKTDLTFTVQCNVPSAMSPSITIASSNLVPGTQNTLSNISTAADKAEGVGIDLWLGSPDPGGSYTAPSMGLAYPNYGSALDGGSTSFMWNFRVAANLRQIGPSNTVRAGPVTSTATLTFTYN